MIALILVLALLGQQFEPLETTSLVLPDKDPTLQSGLEAILGKQPFRDRIRRGELSVALVDMSRPGQLRYAGVDDDHMRYAASLPKIGILLGVFDQIERGNVEYTPELRRKMENMIRKSSNPASTELIELVGFEAIAATLTDPRYQLYDADRQGGIWVGRDYGGGQGLWQRDPIHHISHGATARQAARFFVMLQRQELISPWASLEMKAIMGKPAIEHKFVRGLKNLWPNSRIFRKSGTWRTWHADAALVERDGKRYVAVALMESKNAKGVLSSLIVQLDRLVMAPPAR